MSRVFAQHALLSTRKSIVLSFCFNLTDAQQACKFFIFHSHSHVHDYFPQFYLIKLLLSFVTCFVLSLWQTHVRVKCFLDASFFDEKRNTVTHVTCFPAVWSTVNTQVDCTFFFLILPMFNKCVNLHLSTFYSWLKWICFSIFPKFQEEHILLRVKIT